MVSPVVCAKHACVRNWEVSIVYNADYPPVPKYHRTIKYRKNFNIITISCVTEIFASHIFAPSRLCVLDIHSVVSQLAAA